MKWNELQAQAEGYANGLSWPDAWEGTTAGGPWVHDCGRPECKLCDPSKREHKAWIEGWCMGHADKLAAKISVSIEMHEIARRARKNKLDEARMWALSYLPCVRDTIAATAEKGETSCSIRMEIKGTWRSLWRSKPATSCQVETMVSMIRELGFEAFPRLGSKMQFEPIDSQVYEIQIFWS